MVNKFLLAGDKFMPEMHLREPGFTYSACGPFIKNKERIQKFKETGDSRYIYQNELDEPCFQHDMTYRDSKDLTRRTTFDTILCHKAFNILLNILNMMNIKEILHQWFISFLIKKTSAARTNKFANSGSKNENISNKELSGELHKAIIRKF